MVVRELITLLGIKTDEKSVKKAESSFQGLLKTAAKLAAAYLSIDLAKRIISSASDVNETLNVLNANFGESAENVKVWAEEFGNAAGRSQFDMREMAGTLGSVLNPLMERNEEAAADMSTRLAQLAVDLGSFFNAAESDVLLALRSGITGEAEPMKKFGVVMNQATLEAFALSQGITKSVKAMTIAEKTALRYNFILDQTVTAHGDAAKTADGWANITKAARGKLKDFGIRIGQSVLPALESLVKWFVVNSDKFETFIDIIGRLIVTIGKVVKWFFKFFNSFPSAAKVAIIVALGVAFLKWSGVLKILLSPMGKIVILIGLLLLIIEDLIVFVEGGESAFGKLFKVLDDMTGLDVSGFFRDLITSIQHLADMEEPFDWGDYWGEMVLVMEQHLASAIEFWKNFWNDLSPDVQGFLDWFGTTFKVIYEYFIAPFVLVIAFIKDVFEVGLIDAFARMKDRIVNWAKDVYATVTTPLKKIGSFVSSLFGGEEKEVKLKTIDETLVKGARRAAMGVGTPGTLAGGVARARPGVGQGASVTNAPETNVQIDVKAAHGMNEEQLAQATAREVSKVIDKQNRSAMNALVPSVAGVR